MAWLDGGNKKKVGKGAVLLRENEREIKRLITVGLDGQKLLYYYFIQEMVFVLERYNCKFCLFFSLTIMAL
jgi:hypothetical protein